MNGDAANVTNGNGVVDSPDKKQLSIQNRTRSWQEELTSEEIDVPGTPRPRKNTQTGRKLLYPYQVEKEQEKFTEGTSCCSFTEGVNGL